MKTTGQRPQASQSTHTCQGYRSPFPAPRWPIRPTQPSPRSRVTGGVGEGGCRALPLKDVGREGLGTDVRHGVFLNPEVVLLQALRRCRGCSLSAVAAHLWKTRSMLTRTEASPAALPRGGLRHPESRLMGRADSPEPSDTRGPRGVPFPVCLLASWLTRHRQTERLRKTLQPHSCFQRTSTGRESSICKGRGRRP